MKRLFNFICLLCVCNVGFFFMMKMELEACLLWGLCSWVWLEESPDNGYEKWVYIKRIGGMKNWGRKGKGESWIQQKGKRMSILWLNYLFYIFDFCLRKNERCYPLKQYKIESLRLELLDIMRCIDLFEIFKKNLIKEMQYIMFESMFKNIQSMDGG